MKTISNPTGSTSEINVGRRLRELRTANGLSIRALARQSGLNVNTLSSIENNSPEITDQRFLRR